MKINSFSSDVEQNENIIWSLFLVAYPPSFVRMNYEASFPLSLARLLELLVSNRFSLLLLPPKLTAIKGRCGKVKARQFSD